MNSKSGGILSFASLFCFERGLLGFSQEVKAGNAMKIMLFKEYRVFKENQKRALAL
jgi:hypothetical protein